VFLSPAPAVDESTISAVVLTWSGPGASGSQSMTARGGGQWFGRANVAQVNGTWTWQATATDARRNQGFISGSIVVRGC
jgi:hypothetical protein